MQCRVYRDNAGSAYWNMALDEALLLNRHASLRFYRWERASLTLGRNQQIVSEEDIFGQYGAIEYVRRMTGGRAVLHGDDITVSCVIPVERLSGKAGETASPSALYKKLLPAFQSAIAAEGKAALPGGNGRVCSGTVPFDCFEHTSPSDLAEVGSGKKVMGAALYLKGEWALMQASLPCGLSPGASKVLEEGFLNIARLHKEVQPYSRGVLSMAFQLKETKYNSRRWNLHGSA